MWLRYHEKKTYSEHKQREMKIETKKKEEKNNEKVIHYFKKEKKLSETPVNHN